MGYAVCHTSSGKVRFTMNSLEDAERVDCVDCIILEIPDDKVGYPLIWDGDDEFTLDLTVWWNELRAERDRRLTASDKYVLPDFPIGEPERAVWIAYRVALRAVPENTIDPRSPNWPAPPE